MNQTVIKVENLSKKYILGEIGYNTLYHTVQSKVAKLLGKEDPNKQISSIYLHSNEEFWALKDINFEIKQGERVGIIGRNGAGKSTLLKILSKVASPSSGSIKIKGRVASLLEVGTGFHPELTGRDNIFLNGTILGMNKREIDKKLDEIIAFAEVEQFVDTPVKRYSSGMYVRLAFAVAAHLEPEILIVDEVLAVGDAAFQKKALGKMEDVSNRDGRTILFVSHNMGAIKNLCDRSMLLEKGTKIFDDSTELTLSKYNQSLREVRINEFTNINNDTYRRGSGHVRITDVVILDKNDDEQHTFGMNDVVRVMMSFKVLQKLDGVSVFVGLRSGNSNEIVTSVRHIFSNEKIQPGDSGSVCVEFAVDSIRPGEYPLYLQISEASLISKKYEVLDDATPPLTIFNKGKTKYSNFEPSQTVGCFSIPSRIIRKKINKPK